MQNVKKKFSVVRPGAPGGEASGHFGPLDMVLTGMLKQAMVADGCDCVNFDAAAMSKTIRTDLYCRDRLDKVVWGTVLVERQGKTTHHFAWFGANKQISLFHLHPDVDCGCVTAKRKVRAPTNVTAWIVLDILQAVRPTILIEQDGLPTLVPHPTDLEEVKLVCGTNFAGEKGNVLPPAVQPAAAPSAPPPHLPPSPPLQPPPAPVAGSLPVAPVANGNLPLIAVPVPPPLPPAPRRFAKPALRHVVPPPPPLPPSLPRVVKPQLHPHVPVPPPLPPLHRFPYRVPLRPVAARVDGAPFGPPLPPEWDPPFDDDWVPSRRNPATEIQDEYGDILYHTTSELRYRGSVAPSNFVGALLKWFNFKDHKVSTVDYLNRAVTDCEDAGGNGTLLCHLLSLYSQTPVAERREVWTRAGTTFMRSEQPDATHQHTDAVVRLTVDWLLMHDWEVERSADVDRHNVRQRAVSGMLFYKARRKVHRFFAFCVANALLAFFMLLVVMSCFAAAGIHFWVPLPGVDATRPYSERVVRCVDGVCVLPERCPSHDCVNLYSPPLRLSFRPLLVSPTLHFEERPSHAAYRDFSQHKICVDDLHGWNVLFVGWVEFVLGLVLVSIVWRHSFRFWETPTWWRVTISLLCFIVQSRWTAYAWAVFRPLLCSTLQLGCGELRQTTGIVVIQGLSATAECLVQGFSVPKCIRLAFTMPSLGCWDVS